MYEVCLSKRDRNDYEEGLNASWTEQIKRVKESCAEDPQKDRRLSKETIERRCMVFRSRDEVGNCGGGRELMELKRKIFYLKAKP